MGKKVNLPLFEDRDPDRSGEAKSSKKESAKNARESDAKKPSIDAARSRLGGRTTTASDAGEPPPPAGLAPGVIVTFAVPSKTTPPSAASTTRRAGVIIYASASEVHVLLDGIRLRRMPPEDLELVATTANVDVELHKIAADARLFGQLVEGQSVRYADDAARLVDGKVIEKCRWGALVLRDDGAIIAVGFRKLWPSPEGAAVFD